MASIRKRRIVKDGKEKSVWVADCRPHGGQPYFERRKEAEEYLARIAAEVAAGTYTPDRRTITFLEAGELWLERNDVESTQAFAYEARSLFNCHLRASPLASVKLSQLTEHMIDAFFKKIREESSLSRAHTVYKTIKQIVRFAKKRRLCNQGVLEVVEACRPSPLKQRKKLPGHDIPQERGPIAARRRAGRLAPRSVCGCRIHRHALWRVTGIALGGRRFRRQADSGIAQPVETHV